MAPVCDSSGRLLFRFVPAQGTNQLYRSSAARLLPACVIHHLRCRFAQASKSARISGMPMCVFSARSVAIRLALARLAMNTPTYIHTPRHFFLKSHRTIPTSRERAHAHLFRRVLAVGGITRQHLCYFMPYDGHRACYQQHSNMNRHTANFTHILKRVAVAHLGRDCMSTSREGSMCCAASGQALCEWRNAAPALKPCPAPAEHIFWDNVQNAMGD